MWHCKEHRSFRLAFKSKADTFNGSAQAIPKDHKEPKKAVLEFAKQTTSESRLQQGLEYLREFEHPETIQSIGTFIKWVVEDVLREEGCNVPNENYSKNVARPYLTEHLRGTKPESRQ